MQQCRNRPCATAGRLSSLHFSLHSASLSWVSCRSTLLVVAPRRSHPNPGYRSCSRFHGGRLPPLCLVLINVDSPTRRSVTAGSRARLAAAGCGLRFLSKGRSVLSPWLVVVRKRDSFQFTSTHPVCNIVSPSSMNKTSCSLCPPQWPLSQSPAVCPVSTRLFDCASCNNALDFPF